MSAKAESRFSAGIGRLASAGGKAPRAVEAEIETPATARAGEGARAVQAGRSGKVSIAGYFDPAVRKQLALLAIEEEKSQVELMAEALNLLFEKHGRSPIAKA